MITESSHVWNTFPRRNREIRLALKEIKTVSFFVLTGLFIFTCPYYKQKSSKSVWHNLPWKSKLQNTWTVGLKLSLPQRPFLCFRGRGGWGEGKRKRGGDSGSGNLSLLFLTDYPTEASVEKRGVQKWIQCLNNHTPRVYHSTNFRAIKCSKQI